VYESPPGTFDEMVRPFPTGVQETAHWLRSLILQSFPQVTEGIHGGAKVANALYSVGRPDAVALGLQAGARFVKLFIHDPDHLGKPSFRLEGRGKHMRHIKFGEPPEKRRAELIELMRIPVERRS
jgi:hypothetical protein